MPGAIFFGSKPDAASGAGACHPLGIVPCEGGDGDSHTGCVCAVLGYEAGFHGGYERSLFIGLGCGTRSKVARGRNSADGGAVRADLGFHGTGDGGSGRGRGRSWGGGSWWGRGAGRAERVGRIGDGAHYHENKGNFSENSEKCIAAHTTSIAKRATGR